MGVDRPSGTVTFLFTDIEGSSALWEDDEAAMSAALAQHDEILRRAVASRNGYVFTTAGDSFSAAFNRAADALRAAVEVQQTLAAVFASGRPAIRVRIGLHTGTADERDGDYFGPAVNRAARIMAAANGGQILASDVTAALVEAVAWHDHGEHRLAGVGRPVRLLEVHVDGVLADRPLRTRGAESNLPERLNSFVGRDRELIELTERLAGERLVTLVGVGGTGKTSLAVQAATAQAGSYRDGVWLIEFGLTRSGEALWEVAIETLGISLGQDTTPRERLLDHLSTRHLLLVVDNCEHVHAEAAGVVGEIVQNCPGVTVLATTREALHVVGEHVMALEPLASDGGAGPAVRLFYDRASDEGARLPTTAETVEVVARVCDRLDGIPLAIELAAARARTVPVGEIELLLGERFRLLTGGHHGAAARHSTLRATVVWSYELLDPSERVVFDQLSVFAGSFDVEAAVAVCADADGEVDRLMVVEALGSLVDKSMCVVRIGERHPYRLLETMRAYGLQHLEAESLVDDVGERHAAHYAARLAALTPGFYDGDETPTAEEMQSLVIEVRAAFAWAVDDNKIELARDLLGPLWPLSYRGWYAPTLWVATARDRLPRQDWVIDWLTFEAFMRLDRESCAAVYHEQQRPPDGTSSRAQMLFYAALAEMTMGDLSEKAELVQALRDVSATATSPPDEVMPLFAAALIAMQLDAGGAELAEEVVELSRSCRWQSGEAFGLIARAMAIDTSQNEARFGACEEALEFAIRVGCREVEGIALMQLLVPMLDQPAAIAATHASGTLSFWAEQGNWVNFRAAVTFVAALLAEAGAHRDALLAFGYLSDWSAVGTADVRNRVERAADTARAAIADHQALLRQGASMTNHEALDHLSLALADLEHARS